MFLVACDTIQKQVPSWERLAHNNLMVSCASLLSLARGKAHHRRAWAGKSVQHLCLSPTSVCKRGDGSPAPVRAGMALNLRSASHFPLVTRVSLHCPQYHQNILASNPHTRKPYIQTKHSGFLLKYVETENVSCCFPRLPWGRTKYVNY